MLIFPFLLDAGIKPEIGKIDEEIHQHQQGAVKYGDAEDYRVVRL